jgi:outer membrane protease
MNGRKTLVVLGLMACAQQALASAQVTNEQRLQVGSAQLSLGAGLLNGQSQEKVYDRGDKVSQLNWDIKQVPTLHLGMTFHPSTWLTLDARGWTRLSGGNSHMKDYDWADGSSDWTHFSDHPDTRLKHAWQADVSATVWYLKRDDVALGVLAGYQHTRFDWQSRGGSYIYSKYGYRDDRGNFPAGEKAISYQQTYTTPYLGLTGLYSVRDWRLETRFKYSQWVKARDFDTHHMRATTFAGNNGDKGRMYSISAALSYSFNPQLSVKAGLEHQVYAESRGYTKIHKLNEGERSRTEPNSSAQSSRTTVSSLALAYQF